MLEATLIVVDNSEWMRNGDYTPTRLEAQQDAVNLLAGAKTQMNPENTVGLMSYAGASPEVLVTLTNDLGKIMSSLHTVRIKGQINLLNGLQVAQLALKHRQNKNQRQRIILFVGSPIVEDERALVKLGKKLKKNNVAVDVVNFGEETENTGKLEAFVAAVNSTDNSHLITVPPGPHILSDILIASPLLGDDEGGATAAMAAAAARRGGGGFDFGADGGFDPELELALRISMEEERARQEREAAAARANAAPGSTPAPAESAQPSSEPTATSNQTMTDEELAAALSTHEEEEMEMDEEAMLAQALAMSLMGSSQDKKKDEDNDKMDQ